MFTRSDQKKIYIGDDNPLTLIVKAQNQGEGNQTPQPRGRDAKESVAMFIPLLHFYVLNKKKSS